MNIDIEFKNKVNEIINTILTTKPKFIETKNSYDRKIIYEALEQLELQYNFNVNCNRSKKWVQQYAEYTMCSKHKCGLSGGCDCCSDPFCCGPYCDQCSNYNYCRYAIEKGDCMYKSKICIGINLYYDRQKIRFKKLK